METKQNGAATSNANNNQAPSATNNIFLHSEKNLDDATGVTRESIDEKIDELNELMSDSAVDCKSKIVEVLLNNTTHKEIAMIAHLVISQQRKQTSVEEMFMDLVTKRRNS